MEVGEEYILYFKILERERDGKRSIGGQGLRERERDWRLGVSLKREKDIGIYRF